MTQASPQIIDGEMLSSYVARGGTFAAIEALRVIDAVAKCVAELHAAGSLHLHISPEWIQIRETNSIELAAAAEERYFGGAFFEEETTPAALRRDSALRVPSRSDDARTALREAGLRIDPLQIDIYQLGSLLCRLISGESVGQYVRSPRTRGKIPADIQAVIDAALGHDETNQFVRVEQFQAALHRLLGDDAETLALDRSSPALVSPASDTSPTIGPAARIPDTAVEPAIRPAAPSASDLPFTRLGHYRIDERIGHGGMGDVYLAYESTLDRKVAIKVLPSDFSRHADFVRRFYAEATAAARLVHPNILQVYYIGEDQGHHFFAMQYVEGETLSDLLRRRGRLSVTDTLAIIEQTLAGLAAAHSRHLVHRDIKPGNILLDATTRRALLADFGLVKSIQDNEGGLTATGMVMGTVDYISPEQGRGQPVDARTDLYSIGVLLYQMLSGTLPFAAATPTAMIFQHVYETAKPLHEAAPDLPVVLSRIVGKLMQKDLAARYQTVEALLADLRAFKSGQPLPSGADVVVEDEDDEDRAPSGDGHSRRIITVPQFASEPQLPPQLQQTATGLWQRARYGLLDAARRGAPGLIEHLQNTQQQVDGAVDEYARRHRRLSKVVAEAQAVRDELANQKAEWERAAADAQANSAQADHQRAQQAIDELQSQIDEQDEQLASMRVRLAQLTATLEKLRSQKDLLVARLKVAQARVKFATSKPTRQTRWRKLSPSTTLKIAEVVLVVGLMAIAAGLFYRNLRHTEPADQRIEQVGRFQRTIPVPAPRDALVNETPLLPPAVPAQQFVGQAGHVQVVALSPDESIVASGSNNGTVKLWKKSGSILTSLDHGPTVGSIAFGHTGRLIATGSATAVEAPASDVKTWTVETGELKCVMKGENTLVRPLAFTPDDKVLVGVRRLPLPVSVVRWDVASGKELSVTPIPTKYRIGMTFPIELALRPDGGMLAILNEEHSISLLRTDDLSELRTLADLPSIEPTNGKAPPTSFAFSPDGSVIAGTSTGGIGLWSVSTGELMQSFLGLKFPVRFLAVNNNGRRIAVKQLRGGRGTSPIQIWMPGQNQLIQEVNYKQRLDLQPPAVALSSDGRQLFTGGDPLQLVRWELQAVSETESQSVDFAGGGGTLAISSDRLHILATTSDDRLGVWNYPDKSAFRVLQPLAGRLDTISLSGDGQLAAGGGKDGQIALWDVPSGKLLHQMRMSVTFDDSPTGKDQDTRIAESSQTDIRKVAIQPDKKSVLVVTNHSMFFWDVKTGTQSPQFAKAVRGWSSAAVSRDGRLAVTADRYTDKAHLRLWDLQTRQQIREFDGDVKNVVSLSFSDDGTRMLSGEDGLVRVWDVAAGKELRRLDVESKNLKGESTLVPVRSVAFSANGSLAAAAAGRRLFEWNLNTGELLLCVEAAAMLQEIAFAADDKGVITSGGGVTSYWESTTTAAAARLPEGT